MRRRLLLVSLALALALGACGDGTENSTPDQSVPDSPAPPAQSTPEELPGQLMFSRFDEGTHTFISTRMARPDGSGETALFGPVWSPDGSWIAFSRATSGPIADIFISRPDGTHRRQVTQTSANEITVDWGAGGG